ncbi:hypothetical protein D3C71_1198380 [compost metagenome]
MLRFFAALAGQLRRLAGQGTDFAHVFRALLGGGRNLFHAGGGLLKRRGLLLGTVGQIHAAGRDLARGRRDGSRGLHDRAQGGLQAVLHAPHAFEQAADFTAMVVRHAARQVAIGHALAQRHGLVQGADHMRAEEAQRPDQQQRQQAQRHAPLAPQGAGERGVDIIHIEPGKDQPAPLRVIGRIADLRQGFVGARPRKAVLHIAAARLAFGIEVFEDRQAVHILDGAYVRAHQLGVRVHQQRIVITEHAHVAVIAVTQLRQAPRHILLGLRQRHALADALLAIAQDACRQVQHMTQFGLALGHHLGAALPGIPGAQHQNHRANGEYEPQQLPAQTGIFHSLSSLFSNLPNETFDGRM